MACDGLRAPGASCGLVISTPNLYFDLFIVWQLETAIEHFAELEVLYRCDFALSGVIFV